MTHSLNIFDCTNKTCINPKDPDVNVRCCDVIKCYRVFRKRCAKLQDAILRVIMTKKVYINILPTMSRYFAMIMSMYFPSRN